MYIINKTTSAGTVNTGIECVTLGEALAECKAQTEGKELTTDDGDNYFRLEVYEVLPDGNLEQVHATAFYAE